MNSSFLINVGKIKLPSTWVMPCEMYGEYTLVPATPEFDEVNDQFMKTLGAKGNEVFKV